MFTTDTEILTQRNGWRGHSSLSTKDQVATFNRITEEIEYQHPTDKRIVYNYEGELIHIINRSTNQLLTPDHKVLLKKPFTKGSDPNRTYHWDSSWSFESARALPKVVKAKSQLKLPLAGKYKQGTLSIGPYYAELLGWIITDGDFPKGKRSIKIVQSSVYPKKVARISFLLEQLNVKYSEYTKDKYYSATTKQMEIKHTFYLWASDFTAHIRRDIPDKKPTYELLQLIPSELAAKKAPSLFTGIMGGDSGLYGKKNRKKDGTLANHCIFSQKSTRTRAWFQALCVLIGCRCSEYIPRNKTPAVNISGRDTTIIRKPRVTVKRTGNPLKVWGVETPNHTVVCRRTVFEKNTKGEKVRKSYVFITGATLIE